MSKTNPKPATPPPAAAPKAPVAPKLGTTKKQVVKDLRMMRDVLSQRPDAAPLAAQAKKVLRAVKKI